MGRQLGFLDPKTVEQRQSFPIAPLCNLHNIGIGRWVYQHHDNAYVQPMCPPDAGPKAKCQRGEGSRFAFKEADPETATWAPLRCSVPDFQWHPNNVLQCAAMKNINKIVILGGSTSRYIMGDFKKWMKGDIQTGGGNIHTKEQTSAAVSDQLYLEAMQETSADPRGWAKFLKDRKFH